MLRRIDRAQEREGHPSALLARGRKAESRVPLAPTTREIATRRVAVASIDQQLPDEVRDYWRHSCSEASMIERLPATASTQIVHIVFRDGGEIWRLPCRSGSYAMQFIVAYRVDGNLQRLTQPYRHIGIEPRPLLLEQAEFAVLPGHAIGAAISPAVASAPTSPGAAGLFFLSAHEANQPAACRTTWIWNGRWMDRIEQTCSIGKEAGQFDVILSRERAVPSD